MAKRTIQISGFPSNSSNISLSLTKRNVERNLLEGENSLLVSDPGYFLSNGTLDFNKTYMLKFIIDYHLLNVSETNNEHKGYDFEVLLVKDGGSERQSLKEIFVDAHIHTSLNSKETKEYVCIFKPLIDTFDGISFRLTRIGEDFTKQMRQLNIQSVELVELANLLADKLYQFNIDGSSTKKFTSIQRVGLQGKPGALFSIDGEEMKLNKNGIYEITYDNLDIQHIGWVQGDFLLDIAYTYTETKGGN